MLGHATHELLAPEILEDRVLRRIDRDGNVGAALSDRVVAEMRADAPPTSRRPHAKECGRTRPRARCRRLAGKTEASTMRHGAGRTSLGFMGRTLRPGNNDLAQQALLWEDAQQFALAAHCAHRHMPPPDERAPRTSWRNTGESRQARAQESHLASHASSSSRASCRLLLRSGAPDFLLSWPMALTGHIEHDENRADLSNARSSPGYFHFSGPWP